MVLASRAANEGVDLFDAMDSLSDSAVECYEALYDDGDWSQPVWDLYGEASSPIECDLLFIEEVKLQPPYRGKGIGAQVVRETIATFGSSGVGLVACKPFALQYSQWQADDEEHRALRAKPGFEEQRVADFARVAQFWTELGFRQLPGTEFYAFAPHLVAQPALPRVPRGRRRLTRRSHK
jgi:GNAT superfamily N-acetyltransferase